ncbi:hypothetical protein ABWI01_09465 [Oceanicaulis alexandrii]|uniref:hypothetical protein n=1 Tax=Oceanicaulis alexandrii TaxID=153233 RepID=UPI0035CFFD0F
MIFDLLSLAGLSALAAVLAGLAARQLWRLGHGGSASEDASLTAPPLPSYRPLTPAAFVSSNDQGAFGEALTSVMMAAKGWRPINGKPGTGPQGVDGVFVRMGEEGFQACLIETKTNSSAYAARQMSNAKLSDDLTQLYLTCGDPDLGAVYAHLYKALNAGDASVVKQLWRHHLARGVTETMALGADGSLGGPVTLAPSQIWMQALAASVSELDRGRRYWSGAYPA